MDAQTPQAVPFKYLAQRLGCEPRTARNAYFRWGQGRLIHLASSVRVPIEDAEAFLAHVTRPCPTCGED